MTDKRLPQGMVLLGYFGLFFVLLWWAIASGREPRMPRSLTLILTLGPLMFPLRGLLHGRHATLRWTPLLALVYFTFGVVMAATENTRSIGLAIVLFSVLLFSGTLLSLRRAG
jgi:uncharacterized membrane protein